MTTGLDVPVLTGMWIGNSSDADTGEREPPGVYQPPGGRQIGAPGDPPRRGGPPGGPGGVHFGGYLITLPVGTKWIFGFFGIFAPWDRIPPHPPRYTPPDTPPDTPLGPPPGDPPFHI